jgi:DNA-binding transcriptional ArsR family regulator
MMDDAIVMDKETFRLLASDTRISILKLLRHRDYNLSEISRKLNL